MAWDESKHPRDSDGKFSDGNGSTLSKVEWRLYYKKLADLKAKYGSDYMDNGEIPPILVEDKVVISIGTFETPKVVDIITVDSNLLNEGE